MTMSAVYRLMPSPPARVDSRKMNLSLPSCGAVKGVGVIMCVQVDAQTVNVGGQQKDELVAALLR